MTLLADDADVRPGADDDIVSGQRRQLGETESGLDGHQEQRVIAATEPGAWIGRGEQRIDLGPGEKRDLATRETLAGHGEYALDLRGMGGCFEGRVSKERVNGGQPQIPAPHTQASRLELIQKRPDQRGIHRLQAESRGRRVQPVSYTHLTLPTNREV